MLKQLPNDVHQPFTDFQCDIANEPVANDDVDLTGVDISSFDVTNEIQVLEAFE